jgi:hypothetical protein
VQLNLHVPKDRERLLGRLDSAARRLGRPKNQVVLDAIERYLEEQDGGPQRAPGEFHLPALHLGVMEPWTRADLYLDEEDEEEAP